jgi:hypothetical protein
MIRPEEGVWKIVHSARRPYNYSSASTMNDTEIDLPLADLPLATFWEFLPSAAGRIRTTGAAAYLFSLAEASLP